MAGLPIIWVSASMQGLIHSQVSDNLAGFGVRGRTVRQVAKGLMLVADYARSWLGYLGYQLAPSTWLRESGPR